MRIGMLLASASRSAGGVFEAVKNLALSLQDATTQVSLIGARDRFTAEDAASNAGLDFRTSRRIGPAGFGFAPGIPGILRELHPDLVHAHGLWMHSSLASHRWCAGSGTPHVVSPHGMLEPWALGRSRLKKSIAAALYERRHLGAASAVHALTEAEAMDIRRYGIRAPICVIPNAVALDIPPDLPAPPWFAPGGRTVLFLGRLHPKKGLPNLLSAWKSGHHSLRAGSWRLVIAGWDQEGHRSRLEGMVRDLALIDDVVFAGPLQGRAKLSALIHADAFVLPSRSEGLPMAVLEAWSCSLPVLMTPQCNLPEGAAAGAARIVEGDAISLGDALIDLTKASDAERRAMGSRGRDLVERRYSQQRIAARMRRLYEWILGGGPPPDEVSIT